MTASRVTAALNRAAETLHAEARAHKRAEAQHRRRARDLMRQLEQLRIEAAASGITLTVTAEEALPHG